MVSLNPEIQFRGMKKWFSSGFFVKDHISYWKSLCAKGAFNRGTGWTYLWQYGIKVK
jgi:hypothetical protein